MQVVSMDPNPDWQIAFTAYLPLKRLLDNFLIIGINSWDLAFTWHWLEKRSDPQKQT
jgi:hypothetical protein